MTKDQFIDLLERTFWTFVQAFVGIIVAAGLLEGNGDLQAWKAALIAAGLAAVKGVIAQQFGTGTAATVPADVEPIYADSLGDGEEPVQDDEA